jgi:hypothetical protein
MYNLDKLAIKGTQEEEKQNKNTTQHNMCWVPLYTTKHNKRKQDMRPCKELEVKTNQSLFLGGTRNGHHNTELRT